MPDGDLAKPLPFRAISIRSLSLHHGRRFSPAPKPCSIRQRGSRDTSSTSGTASSRKHLSIMSNAYVSMSMQHQRSNSVDLAIIGGGIAGLTVAYRLQQQSPGLRVALLE